MNFKDQGSSLMVAFVQVLVIQVHPLDSGLFRRSGTFLFLC